MLISFLVNVELVIHLVLLVMVEMLQLENVTIVKTLTDVVMVNSVAHIITYVCMKIPFVPELVQFIKLVLPTVLLVQMVPT
jgi:uncharacterized MAPEG superfamily protein